MLNSTEIMLFIEKVEGKEQLIRMTQYFWFLVHAVLKNTKYISLTRKAQKLSGNLSIVRKVLRFGMPLAVLLNIYYRLSSSRRKLLKLSGDFLSLLFYCSDHLLFLFRVRFILLEKNSKKLQYTDVIRNLSWVCYLIIKIIDTTTDIHKIQNKIQKLSSTSSFSYRNTEVHEQFLSLLHQSDVLVLGVIRNCLDIPVALYFLDPSKIHPILVGVLGTLSSLVETYKIVVKHRYHNQ